VGYSVFGVVDDIDSMFGGGFELVPWWWEPLWLAA